MLNLPRPNSNEVKEKQEADISNGDCTIYLIKIQLA